MSVDYSSKQVWDNRFAKHPDTFEWLDQPDELLSLAKPQLARDKNACVLHIGCGTSRLSFALRDKLCVAPENIINLDYSVNAIELGRAVEEGDPGSLPNRMHWIVSDLLDFDDLRQKLNDIGAPNISLIVEKSCSDALSCGYGFAIQSFKFSTDAVAIEEIEPMQLLAIHLAAVVEPGSLWLALSYSSSRFDFLDSDFPVLLNGGADKAGQLWTIAEHKEKEVQQPALDSSTVHRPPVMNHLYVLKRTDVPVVVRGAELESIYD
ncbi:hypothetical protein BKA62DRAFT_284429 [Auriculariales sp. MPI-PUGE-AT-0066]|nr:hypothetical protein BKA62DRAFT_284429 [Auriculariales sp. MPI-PUGE-AT-0066]